MVQEPTEPSKQPIRARYLGHVTGYQPIRDQYFLVRSFPDMVFDILQPNSPGSLPLEYTHSLFPITYHRAR